ncbi:MAG: Sua5/YciO/YrdC/YwlC family protein [Candidatus Jorgensenbacteria bacterium GW2011_GWA1_48_13]|uniref:L-threonylcarbamoyladenylate synthase n=2 Tax=Candidatus Joergenseniibacteriota TaxID=1752739 RepID=A0A0G1W9N1_9BACT|nr:MAG: Sua5/YciO/YrdC/YwlC family protein [Candidatus Jorgensenbacteria bacterium GW2011_GWA1_48_13]KKU99112.1 MAG: Sua5/YciO/YrdC/YwlC family protein [Candidatus Jorgensenbacteria bacterium GW2011_GWC1_48_8]KKW15478.1 MAG: Sua5/YciO/YrdC/YwlC family protein [Candidatus Jorgensenbacteria bacterium GW2011_GWB1_50_10]
MNLSQIIKKGGVGVIPTDTVYGIVGSVFSRRAVERIYRLRKRDRRKPFIVLISGFGDLKKLSVKPNKETTSLLKKLWPGPVSVILPCKNKKFAYIHRGTSSVAFRLPKDIWLRNFLKKTGPLVAPSANLAGKPPAKTIAEARKYFGNKVDFYFNKGRRGGAPSTLVEIKR